MAGQLWFLLAILGVSNAQYFDWDVNTPLDEYVHTDDGYFDLGDVIDVFNEDGADVYLFNMTSQKWMDETYTDTPIWWHHFAIAIPTDPVIMDAAHLYVEGGSNPDDGDHPDMDTGNMRYIADFARDVGAVAALLRQNPNQPIAFADTPNISRTEDMILARTWKHYILNEDAPPDIIGQMPMVRAARVAVDALIDFSATINPDFEIDKVMPSGFSKRGWVAWLLACVDQRVFAVAPTVLSFLNWNENLHHHNEALGGWSWAFGPYWADDITQYIDHPRAFEMWEEHASDPLRYNVRLEGMPKLISSATGDQFFLPDDPAYFFEELTEPKFLSIFENTDHGMGGHGSRLFDNLMSFFVAAYTTETDGTIHLQLDDDPLSIRAFWADTTNVTCQEERNITGGQPAVCLRDFRQRVLVSDNPIWWEETPIEDLGDGEYSITMDKREDDGYRGFLMQMTFPGAREGDVLDLTTEVLIIPDIFPFERCVGEEECRGILK